MAPIAHFCYYSGGMLLVVRSMAVVVLSILASFAASLVTALLVHLSGQTLSWYTSTWLLVPLYYAPSLMGMATVHLWWKRAVSIESLQHLHSFSLCKNCRCRSF